MEEKKLVRDSNHTVCPIEQALNIIGGKWTFLIIRDLLLDGSLRFNQLRNSLKDISPKTLSLRLKELEEHEIIKRNVHPVTPPHVEYELTEKGKRLESIFVELKEWGLSLHTKTTTQL